MHTETHLNILREANNAAILGVTVMIHTEDLLPIKLAGPVEVTSCQSIAIVQEFDPDVKVTKTWLGPLAYIRGVEIRDTWLPEAAGQIADALSAAPLSAQSQRS